MIDGQPGSERRTAVVTASGSGIGRVTAETLAGAGYRVVMSDFDTAEGRAAAAAVGAEFRPCDVRDDAQIAALFQGLDPVYLLVNNAGIAGPTAPVWEIDPAEWRQTLEVNLTAQFLCARRVLPAMIAAGRGVIVNLSSTAGRLGFPQRSPYSASKWGVRGFTESLAQEVGRFGIRANAIMPGAVRGPRIQRVIEDYARSANVTMADAAQRYSGRHATGRMVEAEEVAALVLFLAGDGAASITGQSIGVDGGFV